MQHAAASSVRSDEGRGDPLLGFATEQLCFEAVLGRGAMGTVYRGRQVRLDRPVAIKVSAPHLLADPDYVERFNREARTLAQLHHPHVVACFDFGPVQGPDGRELLVLVLELVDGSSLNRLCQQRPLRVRQLLGLYRQAAEGLAAAHALGIVHRDLKPDNIMVTRRGQAKLVDFGLAKAPDSLVVTTAGTIIGSPAYMAPELCRGEEPGPAADLYALACALYHNLCGQVPFSAADSLAVLHRHLHDPVPSLAALRPDLAPICDPFFAQALAKAPAQRFADARTMAQAMAGLIERIPAAAAIGAAGPVAMAVPGSVAGAATAIDDDPAVSGPGWRWRRWWPGLAIAGLILLIMAVAGLWRPAGPGSEPPPSTEDQHQALTSALASGAIDAAAAALDQLRAALPQADLTAQEAALEDLIRQRYRLILHDLQDAAAALALGDAVQAAAFLALCGDIPDHDRFAGLRQRAEELGRLVDADLAVE